MADSAGNEIEVRVPEIGDFDAVEVVEILVAKGDRVEVEDSLVSLESDKATMEIPAPVAGVVQELRVSLGDRVSEGTPLLTLIADPVAEADETAKVPLETAQATAEVGEPPPAAAPGAPAPQETAEPLAETERAPGEAPARKPPTPAFVGERPEVPHASPLVRRMARELGVDVARATPTGPKGRVLEEDVRSYVRGVLSGVAPGGEGGIPPVPAVDFARHGPTSEVPLNKLRRVSGRNLTRSWLNVPHVTQHEVADVTTLEVFRRGRAQEAAERGLKLSPLLFVMKAVCVALREAPDFSASLHPDGDRLIHKHSFHLGVAVDTPDGLVVPVIRDVDQKGIFALAAELAATAERARERKLGPSEMQGGVFTISSLGGIGGTAFTPIVNAPEVAILGLSKLRVEPVWSAGLDVSPDTEGRFEPRVILPLSLSYDHRVIDGAAGARFVARLARILGDPFNLLL